MTVVLVDPRRPSLVPVEAIDLLAGDVQYTEEMPVRVPWSLPAARPCFSGAPDEEAAPVLLSSDPDHPAVRARLAAGDKLIEAPGASAGERLVDAVAMMDKLRTSGPWESQQTHDSLRRYLLEETYEVFDAVRSGNADDLRDELGDVLLQVLFHARIAEDAPERPFSIDDVADSLIRKLVNRVPAVLAGEEISLEDQLAQWEERKAMERANKGVRSVMDDVPTGQPALALAQKVIERVTGAGMPADLIPQSMTSVSVAAHVDTENSLRSSVLEFMDTVRTTEHAIAAGRRGDGRAGGTRRALGESPRRSGALLAPEVDTEAVVEVGARRPTKPSRDRPERRDPEPRSRRRAEPGPVVAEHGRGVWNDRQKTSRRRNGDEPR